MEDNFNICTASDSYKFNHWNQYPEDMDLMYAYLESRQGAMFPETVFFGLQYQLLKYLAGPIVTKQKIDRAKARIDSHLGFDGAFNYDSWMYLLKKYEGKLPIRIKAVPEGTVVPTGNVLLTVESTDPKCAWLGNYVEPLLEQVWAPCTVATLSYNVKKMFVEALRKCSDNPEAVNFMLHDFGFRGVTSFSSGEWEGAGHIINFMGTDTFPAVEVAMDYYGAEQVPAFSVPATEHSVMTARGRYGEMEVLGDLLKKYPTGILSVVIDSYDYIEFLENAVRCFKDEILARDGKIVFRPDSGQPSDVLTRCYDILESGFGCTINSKGYKVLNPKVGLLWGDGIDGIRELRSIVTTLLFQNRSIESMIFGMGGGLLQKINRDTQRFAFKLSYLERDGVGYDIFKQPRDGSKTSKKGRFALVRDKAGKYETIRQETLAGRQDLLETVYENGEMVKLTSFEEIRERVA